MSTPLLSTDQPGQILSNPLHEASRGKSEDQCDVRGIADAWATDLGVQIVRDH